MIPTPQKEGSNAKWRKSSRSGANQDCVELGSQDGQFVGLGDTKNANFFGIPPTSARSFIDALKQGFGQTA